MKGLLAIAVVFLALSGAAFAATKAYTAAPFEGVAVAAGVAADIKVGTPQSIIAETDATNFDDLAISVDGNVLRIGRPPGNWFALTHPDYRVHIVVPVLHSLAASSSGSVKVDGTPEGDFAIAASSSGGVSLPALKGGALSVAASSSGHVQLLAYSGGNASARASSGGSIELSGSCTVLDAAASSGGGIKASALKCETVVAHASSGGGIEAFASKSVLGSASSGGDIRVDGKPAGVQVEQSSGGAVSVAK